MSGRTFSGALAWLGVGRREVGRVGAGPEVSVRLSEAVSRPDYEILAEARSMADGSAFYGVEVRDANNFVILEWNSSDTNPRRFPESPHTATVLADLCDALDRQLTAAALLGGDLSRSEDALAAGRLLLSSAAFRRAALAGSGSGSGAVVTAMHSEGAGGQPAEGGQQ